MLLRRFNYLLFFSINFNGEIMNIKIILKGFIVGIGKIIPGVSGSMLAMMMGIYEKLIQAITNFFTNIKENSKLLINFCIGLFIAIIYLVK